MLKADVPSSNMVNLAVAAEFSTRNAVVADVAPEPRTCNRELGVNEPPIPQPLSCEKLPIVALFV